MNKTELIARIAEVSGITAKVAEETLKSNLTETTEIPIKFAHQSRYDFVNSNKSKRKKGKTKKNWE